MEEDESELKAENKRRLASYPIHTIRGVYDSMIYVHTLYCNISESVTRVVSRNRKENDDEEVAKTVDFLKRSLDGTDRQDSIIIEEDKEKEEEEEEEEGEKEDKKKKKRTKKTSRQIQSKNNTSKLLQILPSAVSDGLDALIRKAMSAIPGNRKDTSSLILEYDVVLHILPRSLSSRLASLIETARAGPQPKQLVSNLVERVKQKILPGFWIYNAKCMKPFETIPRSPSKVAMTGYVLEYDVVDETQSRSLTRYMHYDIDRRPFIATVSVPSNREESTLVEKKIRRESMDDEKGHEEGRVVTTPQSFPCSPYVLFEHEVRELHYYSHTHTHTHTHLSNTHRYAREAMINDFASYTNGILQAACDRLRTESDEEHGRIPQIDASQTHDDLRIDCAGLRVSKCVISDRFVSSRANVCITASNRKQQACLPYFFEFVVAEHLGSLMDDDEDEEENEEKERSVLCVGLSTEHMPLNACVGSVQKTVGYHSQGTVGNIISHTDRNEIHILEISNHARTQVLF